MSITAYGNGAVRSRQKLVASVTERWAGAVTASRLLIPAGLAALLVLVYFATHGKTKYALVGVGLPMLVVLLSRSKGAGFLLAVGVLLVIPYWYNHVWLVAPTVVTVGLLAGRARTRFHPMDLVFALVVLVFTASWLFHPELQIPSKQFLQGILPFAFYLWARLSVDHMTLPRLQLVMLVAGGIAACTVLFEAAHGTAVFKDPLTYQWEGSATKVFRGGGIFGGSPTAATVLAMVLLAVIPVHHRAPKAARFFGALILLGIAVTLDRAGYLGLIAGAALFAIILPYRRWLRVGGFAAVLLVAALVVTNSPTLSRNITQSKLVTAGLVRGNTISTRQNLLADSLPLIDDSTSHLLFGRGFDAFEAFSGRRDLNMAVRTDLWLKQGGPNDDYVRTILEQGLLGLLAVVAWLLGSLACGIRACVRLPTGSAMRTTLAGLSAAALCYAVAASGHDEAHNIAALSIAALITGILVSAAVLSRKQPSSAPASHELPRRTVTPWPQDARPVRS